MTVDASQAIAPELEAGESLLWSGRPRKGVVFRGLDVLLIPFSLVWGGGVISVMSSSIYSALKSGSGIPWGAMPVYAFFLLIGLYMMFGRFIVDAVQREHTCYGVTDRRVIILFGLLDRPATFDFATLKALAMGFGRRKLKSLDLRTITDLSMTERSDGSGVITFGAQIANAILAGGWGPGLGFGTSSSSFDQIDQVKSVYAIIRAAQRKAF